MVTHGPARRPRRGGGPLIEVRGLRWTTGWARCGARRHRRRPHAGQRHRARAGRESGSGKSTLAYAITRLLRAPGIITGLAGAAARRRGPAGSRRRSRTLDLLAADERQLRGLRWSRIAVVLQSAMHALNPVFTIGAS
jgi:peptide/nickel transport system ATP-binding protein